MTKDQIIELQSFKTEREYRESPSLNYSTLKSVPNGPKYLFSDQQSDESSALNIGSYVDAYFTDKENLNDRFHVNTTTLDTYTDSMETLFKNLVAMGRYDPTEEEIVNFIKETGLLSNIKDPEKIKAKIPSTIYDRLKMTQQCIGKIVISFDEYMQAKRAIDNIENCKKAMDLISEQEDTIVIDQLKYEFKRPASDENDIDLTFKIMLDKVKFDFKNKTIQPIDIKTGTKEPHLFKDNFFKYRYDLQASIYSVGMMVFAKKHFPDFTVLPFKFLYSPKIENRTPLIVSMTDDFMTEVSRNFVRGGIKYYGFLDIIDHVKYYLINQEQNNHYLTKDVEYDITSIID